MPLPAGARIERFCPQSHAHEIGPLTRLLHEAYAELAKGGMRYLATHQPPEVTKDRLGAGEGYLAYFENILAGTITLRAPDPLSTCAYYRRPGVFFFSQFGVGPAFQGQGLGTALMDFVEARAASLNATELALDTSERASHLIALYSRRGYRLVDHTQWEGVNYRSVIMSKALAP